ncbi:hypothetical protein PENVUL_c002G05109 [Penicillium vulpinum]|uniref:MalT-like TPR region domain-containing protein n=1 Tax=Penicillium vulpinum TaxID=29845 RepID=A0A1V6SD42_9EURO|nr:hypothetical protein PENVUL_c002G05109 [Penicillium vulpinum]
MFVVYGIDGHIYTLTPLDPVFVTSSPLCLAVIYGYHILLEVLNLNICFVCPYNMEHRMLPRLSVHFHFQGRFKWCLEGPIDLSSTSKAHTMPPEAKLVYRDVWDLRKQTFGKCHEDSLWSLHWLVQHLCSQEKHKEAEALCRDAWEGQKYALAEAVYRDVWEGRKRTLGKDDEDTLGSLYWVGDTLFFQHQYALAETTYRDVWESRKETFGVDHEDTLGSLYRLGRALYCQEKYALAEAAYRDTREGRKRVFGEQHADTFEILHELEQTRQHSS